MEPKILLIDDSAILRRIAVNVLSAKAIGGEVITATRATEGFARACTSKVGLILVDYQLAGLPDADLCRRLQAEPRTSRVPVILLLGPGMMPPVKNTLPVNVVDYLVKPFTPEQLVSAVKAAFASTREGLPATRLREPANVPDAGRAGPVRDHQEAASVVNATTLAGRETDRFVNTRTAAKQVATASAARETAGGRTRVDPTRLRTALRDVVRRQETGVFRVKAGQGPATEVYLENGQFVVVATTDAKRYGEDADGVVPPKVSPATLEEAVSEQGCTGVPFFLALGSRGLLSKAAATGLLHRFGQRQFARFWAVPPESLTFEFVAMDALPGFALRLEPRREPLDQWLLEASRYFTSQDISASARHEGFAGVPLFKEQGASRLEALGLNEQERDFCRQIGACRDLSALAKSLGIAAEHAYLLLFRFRCLGAMDYRPTASAFVVTPRTNVRRVLPLHR